MPQLEVKTVSASQVWASPDGNRKIWELQLEWEGKPVSAKTYSEAIATPGWSGTVETYEKPGQGGKPAQTFVKQPPKEGASYAGGGRQYGTSGKPISDPFTMYLSYAKDLAVALIATKDGFDEGKYGELLGAVLTGGNTLYEGRPDAQGSQASITPDVPVKPDTVVEPSTEDLNKVLGGEILNGEETPWDKQATLPTN